MFADFIGNNKVLDELERNIETDDISHAYLFTGNEGVGKFTVAKEVARRILCNNSSGSCLEADEFFHPDLMIIRAENGSIKKSDIDEMIADSYKKPFVAENKVYIIDGFDFVTVSGQNALLKTLEEPQEYLRIILLSNNIKKILPTIISRSRIIKFKDISENEIVDFLHENIGTGIDNARLFARISGGSVKKALDYSRNPSNVSLREEAVALFDRLVNGTSSYPFKEFEFFNENKERLKDIFNIFLSLLRDITSLNLGFSEDVIINIDKINLLKRQNINNDQALYIKDSIMKVIRLLEMNTNFQLTVEEFLINIGGVK